MPTFAPMQRAASWEDIAFAIFTLALAAGPLDRAVYEGSLPAIVRAVAWGMAYLGFVLMFLSRPLPTLSAYARVWPLLLMPGLALLSTAWSMRPAHTVASAVELGAAIAFGAALGDRLDERRLLGVLVAVFGGLAAVDLAMVLLSPQGLDANGDAVGLFSHKNANGGVMATAVLASGACLAYGRRRTGVLAVAALCLLLLAWSGSRTSWLAALAGLLAMLVLALGRYTRATRAALAVATLAGLCLLALVWLGSGFDPVAKVLAATDKDPTLTGRTDLWSYAWRTIRETPWLGHGYDAFWTPDDPSSDAAFVNDAIGERLKSFHNGVLESAVDLGWLGTILQLALLVGFVAPLRRLARLGDPAAAAFAAALLVQVALTNLTEVALFLRHGFDLMLLSALWSRANALPDPAMEKPPALPGYGGTGGGVAGKRRGIIPSPPP